MDNAHEAQKDNIGFSLNFSFSEMTEEAQQQIKEAAAEICKDISGHLDIEPIFQKYKEFPTTELAAQIVLADAIETLTQNASFSQLCEIISKESNADKIFPIMESAAEKAGKAALVDPYKIVILCGGMDALKARINNDFLNTFLDGLPDNAKETISLIAHAKEFQDNETYKKIKAGFAQILFLFREYQKLLPFFSEKDTDNFLRDTADPRSSLLYYIALEMDDSQDPDISEITIGEVLRQGLTESKEPAKNKYGELIERAQKRQAADAAAQEENPDAMPAKEDIPRIISKLTEKLNYPLDKPNSVIWNLLASADTNGQLKMQIDTGKKGSGQDSVVYYGINFDELESGVTITKQLTPFDKRCYIAAAALYNGGNKIFSATQVYNMMGNPGKPQTSDIKKVNDSLTKMGAARVYIDNEKETKAAKGYKRFKYDAALLPFERISAYINGQLTESAIHLFREPPLISFARQRNQITTLTRQLLESPINKTDANLRLEDYLLERIGHMKSPNSRTPRKMLFSTIYSNCEIKTAKQKQRAPEKIRRYLDYYKKTGWIKDYQEDTDGITILL